MLAGLGVCPQNSSIPALMQTLERSYLLRVNGKVVERPQHMLMRVAVGIHMEDIDAGGWLGGGSRHWQYAGAACQTGS